MSNIALVYKYFYSFIDDSLTEIKVMIRILKNDGLLCIIAPFSYKYHGLPNYPQHPLDYWRFSPTGLEFLVNHYGKTETTMMGYYTADQGVVHETASLSLYVGKKYEDQINV